MDYTLETRDSANKLKGVLKEAYSCRYVQVGNEPSRLVFSYPADGIFASEIKRANLVWLKNEAGSILDKFHLQTKHSARSQDGFAYYEVDYQSLACQLADEIIDNIDVRGFADKTIAYVISYLFTNYQMNANPISVGSIDAVIGDKECEVVGENVSILELIKEMWDATGGYYYVDKDRKFYWKVTIGEDKGQQLRYAKNLKGIERVEDYSSIVTRLYYYGAGISSNREQNKLNLKDDAAQLNYYLDSDTQGDYDIIPKSLTNFTIYSGDVLLAVAQQYLADHKNPIISYRINFADLSEFPEGISFDKLQLGSKVKVIDEDLGIDVETYIVKIDKNLDHPENTEVELCSVLIEIIDEFVSVHRKQGLLEGGSVFIANLDTLVITKGVYFKDKMKSDMTAIIGDFIRTGKIQSDNWGAGAGTEIDLTGETIKIGGSAAPKLSWDGTTFNIEGVIKALSGQISGLMDLLSGGELRLGTGTPGTDFTGIRIFRDGTTYRVAGYSNDVLQGYTDSDGKIKAGGGSLILDDTGIKVDHDVAGSQGYRSLYTIDAAVRVGEAGWFIIDGVDNRYGLNASYLPLFLNGVGGVECRFEGVGSLRPYEDGTNYGGLGTTTRRWRWLHFLAPVSTGTIAAGGEQQISVYGEGRMPIFWGGNDNYQFLKDYKTKVRASDNNCFLYNSGTGGQSIAWLMSA